MEKWTAVVALVAVFAPEPSRPAQTFKYPSAPLLPIAPLFEENNVMRPDPLALHQRAAPSVTRRQSNPPTHSFPPGISTSSGDHCNPSPCGANTRCTPAKKPGVVQCRCLEGFIPDGNTIQGCKPECEDDNECSRSKRCQNNKCVDVCEVNTCGFQTTCRPVNHSPQCSCVPGYEGNPNVGCNPVQQDPPPPPNPCSPNPCGENADCSANGLQAVCKCPTGFIGNALDSCVRAECISNDECPDHKNCQKNNCIDPCTWEGGVCGANTNCVVENHQPVCSCKPTYYGNAFNGCTKKPCDYDPCGENTICTNLENRASCACKKNHAGDPLQGCRYVDPCSKCAIGAQCQKTADGDARCYCPQYFSGNPNVRCHPPQCMTSEDCPDHKACVSSGNDRKCVDPCADQCGINARCRVENHQAICSCPKNYQGHPFERCTPIQLCEPNPCGTNAVCREGKDKLGQDRPVCSCPHGFVGKPLTSCQRGECLRSADCLNQNHVCYNFNCQHACRHEGKSVCGDNAECNVRNRVPVCSCPTNYSGNPLTMCNLRRRSSNHFAVGRFKRG